MKIRLYAVYDRIAEESGPIFEAKNDGIAKRNYDAFIQSQVQKDELGLFEPTDFQCLFLGDYDKTTCTLTPAETTTEVIPQFSHVEDINND